MGIKVAARYDAWGSLHCGKLTLGCFSLIGEIGDGSLD